VANGRGARRSLRGAPHALAVALALGLASACTLTNDLDVCAGAPAAVGVNQHIDGNQSLESPATMAVMPSGEALVLFGSTVAGRDAENALEMRAVRVTSAGAPVAGCTTRDEREQSFFPVAVGDPTAQVTRAVQVLPAPGAMVIQFTGLTLVTRKVGTAKAEVIATSVGPQGCFGATSEPFTVTELAANRGLAPDVFPKAVPLAVEGGTQPYAIFWVENDLSLRRVGRARMIRTRGGLVETVETLASPTGAPVDLDLGGGALVTALDVTATSPS
jgi:hypothetical protein